MSTQTMKCLPMLATLAAFACTGSVRAVEENAPLPYVHEGIVYVSGGMDSAGEVVLRTVTNGPLFFARLPPDPATHERVVFGRG